MENIANYTIRPAHFINDIDAVMVIEVDSFNESIRETEKTFVERMASAHGCSYLLWAKDDAIGYFFSEIWEKEPELVPSNFLLGHSAAKSHVEDGSVLYISSFALTSPARGKKVVVKGTVISLSRMFFRAAIEKIILAHPNITSLYLLVNEEWISAIHIYTSEGFSFVAEFDSFEGFGKSKALVMRKLL